MCVCVCVCVAGRGGGTSGQISPFLCLGSGASTLSREGEELHEQVFPCVIYVYDVCNIRI